MRYFAFIILILFIPSIYSQATPIDAERLARVDEVINAGIKKGNCPGAVLVVVHQDAVVYRKAYGNRQVEPNIVPMTIDTVFDLASLTKPLATGSSAMVLIEQGKLRLSDPVSKHWPEFAVNDKKDVTVEHLMLHTSGLIADNAIGDYKDGREAAIKNIAELKLEAPVGTRFKYSDVGFITLGVIVEKISGKPLDQFAAENVFDKLKMTNTRYTFAKPETVPFAPTGIRDNKVIIGTVHDPRAYKMGSVAGHAGLFGTADDLARYCRMLLRGGEFDGNRVLSPLGVKLFTEGRTVPGGQRSPGWDVDTGYSSQRGELFPVGDGYGHTGFTGTSIWIDPPTKTAIILLTNRTHPNEKKGNVVDLRRQVSTIVASAITMDPKREKRK